MKHLLSILIFFSFMSVANAWSLFDKPVENLLEVCANKKYMESDGNKFTFYTEDLSEIKTNKKNWLESCIDLNTKKISPGLEICSSKCGDNIASDCYLNCTSEYANYDSILNYCPILKIDCIPDYDLNLYHSCKTSENLDKAWDIASLSYLNKFKFLEKNLSIKLDNLIYIDAYQMCEVDEKLFPKTFKAKWSE